MLKLVLFALGGVVVVGVVVVGGVAAAFAAGVLRMPEATEITNRWGTVTAERTEVLTRVRLYNPNNVRVGLDSIDLRADVYLNDAHVGSGVSEGIDLPQGESTTELVTVLDNSRIAAWWPTHVANGERSVLRLVPRAQTSIFGWTLSIPGPSVTETVTTNIVRDASSDVPHAFSLIGDYGVTLLSRRFAWGRATQEVTEIEGVVVVRNDSPVPIPVSQVRFRFSMNGIPVGEGTTYDPALLLPAQAESVPFGLTIDNARIIEWWPTHIRAGERTEYRVQVSALFEMPLPVVGRQAFEVPLVDYRDQFATDILAQ